MRGQKLKRILFWTAVLLALLLLALAGMVVRAVIAVGAVARGALRQDLSRLRNESSSN